MLILRDKIIQKILSHFQTSVFINLSGLNNNQLKEKIKASRTNVNINSDIKTIIALSETCKQLNYLTMKSNEGLLFWTIYYNSLLNIDNKAEHISLCNLENCSNICHYINKNIFYRNILKRIEIHHMSRYKKYIIKKSQNRI